MDVHFPPELQARITERALREGRALDETVIVIVARFFEEDHYVDAVKRGEAAFLRGESLTHEQVGDCLKRFLQS